MVIRLSYGKIREFSVSQKKLNKLCEYLSILQKKTDIVQTVKKKIQKNHIEKRKNTR